MSNKRVFKRQSGSTRNARRNRERRKYRDRCGILEKEIAALNSDILATDEREMQDAEDR